MFLSMHWCKKKNDIGVHQHSWPEKRCSCSPPVYWRRPQRLPFWRGSQRGEMQWAGGKKTRKRQVLVTQTILETELLSWGKKSCHWLGLGFGFLARCLRFHWTFKMFESEYNKLFKFFQPEQSWSCPLDTILYASRDPVQLPVWLAVFPFCVYCLHAGFLETWRTNVMYIHSNTR